MSHLDIKHDSAIEGVLFRCLCECLSDKLHGNNGNLFAHLLIELENDCNKNNVRKLSGYFGYCLSVCVCLQDNIEEAFNSLHNYFEKNGNLSAINQVDNALWSTHHTKEDLNILLPSSLSKGAELLNLTEMQLYKTLKKAGISPLSLLIYATSDSAKTALLKLSSEKPPQLYNEGFDF